MEKIRYKNQTLYIKTLLKGTLLFRLTKFPENDVRGVPLEDGTRCIIPNFNVFFYPNPFAGELAFKEYLDEFDENVYVYVLEQDVKVLYLLIPSPLHRGSRTRKNGVITKCSTVKKGCMPRKLSAYDICLEEAFIKKYPHVVGIMSNPVKDSKAMKAELSKPENQHLEKYFHYAEDSLGITALPEVSLNPLVERPIENVIVNKKDKLDLNYKLLKKFKRGDPKIETFMDKHAEYDADTFHFIYKK
jgi:hypothetical protein